MKLGLSMWSFVGPWKRHEMQVTDFIRLAHSLGVQGVELLDFFFRNPNDWENETLQIEQTLQETGLPCGVFSVGNSFANPNPNERNKQVDIIRRGVDQAQRLGARVVRVFAGGDTAGHSEAEAFGWFLEGLAKASQYAHEHGIKLALENHGLIAGKSQQVCSLIEKVREQTKHDALGANPDTGNFLLVNQAPLEGVKGVAHLAYMCHFKDFARAPQQFRGPTFSALNGDQFIGTAIGEGEVPLQPCTQALKEAGFEGWLNIEYESEEDPRTGVPRSVENARKCLEQVL
jgi:sugar phosphate isomerase/epimerase